MRICLGDRILDVKDLDHIKATVAKNDQASDEAIEDAWLTHNSTGLKKKWEQVGNSCS
jgi:hypothetical protein